eukprot:883002-Amphidinium_carterae.1
MSALAKRSSSPPPGGSQKKLKATAKNPQRGAMLPDGLHGSPPPLMAQLFALRTTRISNRAAEAAVEDAMSAPNAS